MRSQFEVFAQKQQQLERFVAGYVSYDFGCMLYGVTPVMNEDIPTPLLYAVSFSSWVSFEENYAIVRADDSTFINEVKEILKRPLRAISSKIYTHPPAPMRSRAWYGRAYRNVQAHIIAGDVYQINLTHQLQGTAAVSGLGIFRSLTTNSQSNFQAYLSEDNFEIISLSPERFIRIESGVIETTPIKGTRPRGADRKSDAALKHDLATNPKDRAELDMITDLMRNDIGAISEVGTVEVVNSRAIRRYPTLWHAHSIIRGKLQPAITPISALLTLMPGGSITGCPKKRAIELINEIEGERRGVYTGSVFMLDPRGKLDSNIAIRTLIKKNDQLYLSVGGGVVHGSDEESEYRESLDKAASFLAKS